VSFDYYDIEIDDQPTFVDTGFLFDQELQLNMGGLQGFDTGPTAIHRDAMGNVTSIENRTINLAGIKTSGFDVEARYKFALGNLGDFSTQFSGSKVNNYVGDSGTGNGFERIPFKWQADWRATLATNWSRGDFSATLIGNAIASSSLGDEFTRLGSYVTWDVQFGWATPWNGAITIGARNLFDEDPPTSGGQYTNQLHDVYGRVPYIRYEQDL
jgi:iron complex outermembrane receptor protein